LNRGGRLEHLIIGAVVVSAVVVPTLLAAAAGVVMQSMAVDARLARGQQVASATATLVGVARETANLADLDVAGAYVNAAIDDDVEGVVVTDHEGNTIFVAMAPYLDSEALLTSLALPPDNVFVVDAAVQERDRISGVEVPVATVKVRLRAPAMPIGFLAALFGVGLVAVVTVVVVVVGVIRRRALSPLSLVTAALKRAAAGDTDAALKDVDDARDPNRRPLQEVDALFDAFDALLRASNERAGLQKQLAQGMGAQVATLPPSLVQDAPREAEVAVVVVDVRDFTALQASLSPTLAVAFVDRLLSSFVSVVERHGGHVERFLGDGVVALFGAPNASPDAVVRAAACAVDLEVTARHLVETEREHGVPRFMVGVGVAAGTSAVGVVGPPSRRVFMALGEVPARARKIQQEAKSQSLGVLVDDVVYAAAKAALPHTSWKKLPPMVIRGLGVPLTLYRPQRVERENDDVTALVGARRP
jgi:class 3 adenylate cyclase